MAAGSSKPVLYYTFENGTGTTVTDRSNAGNNLDGGLTGDWDGTNKKRGSYSANFASCEYVGNGKPIPDGDSIGDLTTFKFMHEACIWTISTWVRMTTSAYQAICGNTASNHTGRLIIYSSGIRVFGAGGDVTFAGSTLTLNTWTHLLVTCSGTGAGNLKLYLDGVQTGGNQTGGTGPTGNCTNTWSVGGTGYGATVWCGQSWQGQIDEYSIWDVAFTDDDVATIYNSGSPFDVSDGIAAGLPSGIKDVGGIAGASVKMVGGIEAGSIKNIMGIS